MKISQNLIFFAHTCENWNIHFCTVPKPLYSFYKRVKRFTPLMELGFVYMRVRTHLYTCFPCVKRDRKLFEKCPFHSYVYRRGNKRVDSTATSVPYLCMCSKLYMCDGIRFCVHKNQNTPIVYLTTYKYVYTRVSENKFCKNSIGHVFKTFFLYSEIWKRATSPGHCSKTTVQCSCSC